MPVDLEAAYTRCEAITSAEAKNFAYGIKLLPADKRRAMSALYALARRIDDIGDGHWPVDRKLDGLDDVRRAVDSMTTADADPVMACVADTVKRYGVSVGAIHELIDGCVQDCRATSYVTFDELVAYCRLVAGSVGRMSLAVFGHTGSQTEAERRSDELGVALQITNILRDIAEDRETMGRVYLPSEDIERFGCARDLTGPTDAMAALVSFEAQRAETWYGEGLGLLAMLDRRSAACTAAMAGIYRRLLRRIESDPARVLSERVSLPTWEKAYVAVRSIAGASP
jgi:phytoene synthase